MPDVKILVLENEEEVTKTFAKTIEDISNAALAKNKQFMIGVSGGSIIKLLVNAIPRMKTDLSRWRIFFCDERVVPESDPESTFGCYRNGLLGKVALTEDQFVPIRQGVSADEAAKDYVEKLKNHFVIDCGGLPTFHLLLLGMGPDGHTCSLFPQHSLLTESSLWIAPITDSPKPPPARITMTYPLINNAKNCIFAMTGEGKADMLKRILVDKEDLPAGKVKPKEVLYWIMDKAAGKHVQPTNL